MVSGNGFFFEFRFGLKFCSFEPSLEVFVNLGSDLYIYFDFLDSIVEYGVLAR